MALKSITKWALASVTLFTMAQQASACELLLHDYACCAVTSNQPGSEQKRFAGGCTTDRATAVSTCNTLATTGGYAHTTVAYDTQVCPRTLTE